MVCAAGRGPTTIRTSSGAPTATTTTQRTAATIAVFVSPGLYPLHFNSFTLYRSRSERRAAGAGENLILKMNIKLHSYLARSKSNGPGIRFVVWFQGCTLNCPGCFNPDTHDPDGGKAVSIDYLLQQIVTHKQIIEGVSISGGEPFQQPEALIEILRHVRDMELSTLVFTGYTLDEISDFSLGKDILREIDVLIAGRYVRNQHVGNNLIGSANQRIHFLSDRYCMSDFDDIPHKEIILHRDGTQTVTGF